MRMDFNPSAFFVFEYLAVLTFFFAHIRDVTGLFLAQFQ